MKYKVIKITNNVEECPVNDNKDYPELVEQFKTMEDDFVTLVVAEDGGYWHAHEFFFMCDIKEFETVETKTLPRLKH